MANDDLSLDFYEHCVRQGHAFAFEALRDNPHGIAAMLMRTDANVRAEFSDVQLLAAYLRALGQGRAKPPSRAQAAAFA